MSDPRADELFLIDADLHLQRPRPFWRRIWERLRWWGRLLHLRPIMPSKSVPSATLIKQGVTWKRDDEDPAKGKSVPNDPYRDLLVDLPVITPQKLLSMSASTQMIVVYAITDHVIREQCFDWLMRRQGLSRFRLKWLRARRLKGEASDETA